MFGLFKKKFKCNHDWHFVKDTNIYTNHDIDDGCWIFCLKCEKDELVFKDEWERIKRKQEIIKMHQRD